ncbi:hypothetical protein PFLUV_G00101940 [Perca fluviatilis]|uniref:Uncharacterized protein n=1 Tax=Perca fluviatilis TaxID=8168 RepID=A0A6A5F5U7_PERFL|nr:hypothetical protein PFLUV_G00101940 [Perca fluviatilis]
MSDEFKLPHPFRLSPCVRKLTQDDYILKRTWRKRRSQLIIKQRRIAGTKGCQEDRLQPLNDNFRGALAGKRLSLWRCLSDSGVCLRPVVSVNAM